MATKRELEARLKGLEQLINHRFTAAERALDLAHRELDRWRDNANEWRGAMEDRERTFMPRSEAEQRFAALMTRLDELSQRSSEGEGRLRAVPWLLAGVGTLVAVATLAIALVGGRG